MDYNSFDASQIPVRIVNDRKCPWNAAFDNKGQDQVIRSALESNSDSCLGIGNQLGIGGAVTCSPLPHHPTCGSASGGSAGYASPANKSTEHWKSRSREHV